MLTAYSGLKYIIRSFGAVRRFLIANYYKKKFRA